MSDSRTVLITGCSAGGIGHALAKEFHLAGCRVIATARNVASMQELADLGVEVYTLDVTDRESIRALKKTLTQLLGGKLDILVNNAGVSYHGTALDIPLEAARGIIDVNFFGVMLMVQEFTPLLIESAATAPAPSGFLSYLPFYSRFPTTWTGLEGGRGIIINIGSVNSIVATPFAPVYNASKAALNQYSNCLRVELAPFNVKVLVMITGAVKSNIIKPRSLPSGSLYEPMRDEFDNIGELLGAWKSTPAEVYAQTVIAEAMRPYPRAWVFTAKFSWTAWIASFLPVTAFDRVVLKRSGLLKFAQKRQSLKAKLD